MLLTDISDVRMSISILIRSWSLSSYLCVILFLSSLSLHEGIKTCADPEIFMRGGPTNMVIFGHRRGGVQPPKNLEITFF